MRPALIRCLNPWLVILAVGLFGNALISASVELPWWAVGAAWTVFGACMGMAYADAYETRADRTRSADARLSAALDRIGSALAPEYDEAQRRARLVIRRG